MNSTRRAVRSVAVVAAMAVAILAVASHAGAASVVNGMIVYAGGGTEGPTTVDHMRFTVNSAGAVGIDVMSWEWLGDSRLGGGLIDLNRDGEYAYLDTHIHLFADDGSLDAGDLIASNDNMANYDGGGLADGSLFLSDSYLAPTLEAGSYILALGAAGLSLDDALSGLNTNGAPLSAGQEETSDHGDYRVVFSGDVDVVDGVPYVPGVDGPGDTNGDGVIDENDLLPPLVGDMGTPPRGPDDELRRVVPEPLTMLGVFGAVAGVGGYIRKRRAG